ncbi:PspA/IM30 family protein [Planctomicrobium sp. SH661]|uniref:PspA/IM30 family protein n=1 Tax=Planctomicrobium sp. SH661 TaxID=3448124 RepID=UPI003F5C6839
MSWMKQFTLIMRSNITCLKDSIENPERVLHQLVIDMEEELETVRKSVAGAMADEILLKKRVAQSRMDADAWLERARQALLKQDDASAKAALDQKGLAEERAERLEQEHARQLEQTDKLRRAVTDLEDKIRQARQKQSLLSARMVRAESAQRVSAALDRATGNSAFAQFNKLEAKVERSEAMAEAFERLDGRDPDAEELARKFDADRRTEKLEQELQALKNRIQDA